MHGRTLRVALPIGVAATLLATMATGPAHAQPQSASDTTTTRPAHGSRVFQVTDSLAHDLAGVLTSKNTVRRIVSATDGGVDPLTLRLGGRADQAITAANGELLAAKGLPAASGSILRLRLADPAMRAALARGESAVVAATPTDDVTTSLTGYDHTGAAVALAADRMPARPVLLLDVDVDKALPLGLKVMRDGLAAKGITDTSAALTSAVTATGGYWATQVKAVRLSDVSEPWFKGSAEIYSIVGGTGLDGKPKVDIVQMPYLDEADKTYYPNQLLVHFLGYKYNLADVVMMEDDGDTNYQTLVHALTIALLTVVDGGAYIPLVEPILAAIPVDWYTDDPDFVEAWYTFSKTSTGILNGAGAYGWMEVKPYYVSTL